MKTKLTIKLPNGMVMEHWLTEKETEKAYLDLKKQAILDYEIQMQRLTLPIDLMVAIFKEIFRKKKSMSRSATRK